MIICMRVILVNHHLFCFFFFFYCHSESIVDLLLVKCKFGFALFLIKKWNLLLMFIVNKQFTFCCKLEGIQILQSFAWKKFKIWFQKGFSKMTFNFWIFFRNNPKMNNSFCLTNRIIKYLKIIKQCIK